MKLLILLTSLVIGINAKQIENEKTYLPTIPCIKVKHIQGNIPHDINVFLEKIDIEDFIDVKFSESSWTLDAYVIYKSFR